MLESFICCFQINYITSDTRIWSLNVILKYNYFYWKKKHFSRLLMHIKLITLNDCTSYHLTTTIN